MQKILDRVKNVFDLLTSKKAYALVAALAILILVVKESMLVAVCSTALACVFIAVEGYCQVRKGKDA